jgi:hypothetical protein
MNIILETTQSWVSFLKTDIHHDSVDQPAREVLSLAIGNLTKLLVIALEAFCVLRGRGVEQGSFVPQWTWGDPGTSTPFIILSESGFPLRLELWGDMKIWVREIVWFGMQ